jgi:outer membrane protein TolC
VEQIDVYRLEVQRNNLEADRETTARQIELAVANLKYTMGYPIQQPLTVSDKLEEVKTTIVPTQEAFGAYDTRIDYSILNVQEELAKLDLKDKRAGYLPTLTGSASLGANSASTRFIDMLPPYDLGGKGISGKYDPVYNDDGSLAYSGGYRWYSNSLIGINLNVPVFDGFEKKYKIQQSRLALKKVNDSRELLKNSIDFQVAQANIATKNATARMQTQERNLALAKEVVRVTRIKYKQGVGSSLEVTNAETDLRVAQTNYYSAIYDALVAKVDADLATGRLMAN